MPNHASRLADVPLAELFPSLTAVASVRMVEVADRIDHARSPTDQPDWWWNQPREAATPTTPRDLTPLILDTAIDVLNTGVDWLGLSLHVWQSTPPLLTVTAAVEIACWCATDHNMHPVRQTEWVVGNGDALADAFDAAASTVLTWLDGPTHPDTWRTRAGLPNPNSQT